MKKIESQVLLCGRINNRSNRLLLPATGIFLSMLIIGAHVVLTSPNEMGGDRPVKKTFRCTNDGSKLTCKLKEENWQENGRSGSGDHLWKRYPHVHTTTPPSYHYKTSVPIVGNCTDRRKPGPCSKWVTRWYFNPDVAECEEFQWGGCKTNKNNFKNIKDCQRICPNCRQPIEPVVVLPNKRSPSVIVPLCPGIKRNITLTFKLSKYPLDLYLLMDFTGTMEPLKASVAELSEKLVKVVAEVSSDYTIGFGTHTDKPDPKDNPTGYGFRNNWPLSNNPKGIGDAVRSVNLGGGGLDYYEAQLVGLAQLAVCTEEIKWRPDARHIVVLATDEGFNAAGAGKQFGLTTKYDEECSLNASGYYTKDLVQDYPSVEQVASALNENKIAVIFAISQAKLSFYDSLKSQLNNADSAELQSDGKNVVDLIKKAYGKLESRVELESSAEKELKQIGLDIKYYSTCNAKDEMETTICNDIGPSGLVNFVLEAELAVCPSNGVTTQRVKINPKGVNTGVEIIFQLYC